MEDPEHEIILEIPTSEKKKSEVKSSEKDIKKSSNENGNLEIDKSSEKKLKRKESSVQKADEKSFKKIKS